MERLVNERDITGWNTTVSPAAAATADAYVRAFCTRGLPDPPPEVVRRVAVALALRLSANPRAMRGVTVEGQSSTFPTVGLTFLESLLLNRWRRRSA